MLDLSKWEHVWDEEDEDVDSIWFPLIEEPLLIPQTPLYMEL